MIDRKEVLRYLGYGKSAADENVNLLIDQCAMELYDVASPKHIYKIMPVSETGDEIHAEGVTIKSRNLTKNLFGCDRMVLFAATLGPQVDQLIAKKSCLAMSEAVIMQATAAVAIEEYCDLCQDEIAKVAVEEGFFLRPRFSPGYGDFSIAHQHDFMRLLDCPRKIGLTMTEKYLLVPSKSVTAVIGLSKDDAKCHKSGCEVCNKKDCAFRRS